ncbi:MAG TPA: pyridoxal-phosphate dependent enzyme, partial [Thermoanaerobaculia bacterium]|nr:pyridoxal-phosphate dependent enzyme [Thermoanaerobaculia bacterium]
PRKAERLDTIADSLAAPHAGAGAFALCRRFLDDVVLVDDEALRRSMALLFREMKLAVEPAGAAATAALVGPLAERLRGRKVALVVCGTNTDLATFTRLAAVDT